MLKSSLFPNFPTMTQKAPNTNQEAAAAPITRGIGATTSSSRATATEAGTPRESSVSLKTGPLEACGRAAE